jgi:hypothetical protein
MGSGRDIDAGGASGGEERSAQILDQQYTFNIVSQSASFLKLLSRTCRVSGFFLPKIL